MNHIFYRIKLRNKNKWYNCLQYGAWEMMRSSGERYFPKHIFSFSASRFTSWKTKSKAIEHINEIFKTKPELKGCLYLQRCTIGNVENKEY